MTEEASNRHKNDFESLHDIIDDYIQDHGVIPYCIILQLLAMRYLGAGLIDRDFVDKDYPYRSSVSFSCMFWNLGKWQRSLMSKNPLPEHLEKYRNHIDFELDSEHRKIGDRPMYNNFFVNVVKNLKAHLFMNCEAGSIYDHRARLEEGGFSVCFTDYQDLMVAARIGKNRSVNLTRGRMSMHRVCVYHVHQDHVSRAAALCGEIIATMCYECMHFQVDVLAGDGNKAAYYCTPKNPGCPTYEVSLLQLWIDRMVNTATQARLKNYGPSPPVRAKHFITCSYNDLVHLNHHLRNIKDETYTNELAKNSEGCGDCCMFTLLEWGHARWELPENVKDFESEDHMNHVGEFLFNVNETCLSCDHRSSMVAPSDRDAHNPFLIHLTPSEMTWNEKRQYVPGELKQARKQRREEKQRENRRKAYEEDDEEDDGPWFNFTAQEWLD